MNTTEVSLEEASEPSGSSGVQKFPSALRPDENKVLQDLVTVLKKPGAKSSDVDKIVHTHLGKCSFSYQVFADTDILSHRQSRDP